MGDTFKPRDRVMFQGRLATIIGPREDFITDTGRDSLTFCSFMEKKHGPLRMKMNWSLPGSRSNSKRARTSFESVIVWWSLVRVVIRSTKARQR